MDGQIWVDGCMGRWIDSWIIDGYVDGWINGRWVDERMDDHADGRGVGWQVNACTDGQTEGWTGGCMGERSELKPEKRKDADPAVPVAPRSTAQGPRPLLFNGSTACSVVPVAGGLRVLPGGQGQAGAGGRGP